MAGARNHAPASIALHQRSLGLKLFLDRPRTTIVAGQPLFVTRTTGKIVALGIPLNILLVVVSEVHQMATNGSPSTHNLVSNRLFPRINGTKEVTYMVCALVNTLLGFF